MTNNNDNGFFKKKGTERKRLFLIIGAAVLLLTFIGIYSRREAIFSKTQNSNGSQPAAVKVQTVKADKVVRESIIQNTSIDAVDRVKILPRVTGRLEKLHVLRLNEFGDFDIVNDTDLPEFPGAIVHLRDMACYVGNMAMVDE